MSAHVEARRGEATRRNRTRHGEEAMLAWQAKTQLRGLQPLPAWQGERQLRGLQRHSRWSAGSATGRKCGPRSNPTPRSSESRSPSAATSAWTVKVKDRATRNDRALRHAHRSHQLHQPRTRPRVSNRITSGSRRTHSHAHPRYARTARSYRSPSSSPSRCAHWSGPPPRRRARRAAPCAAPGS